MFPPIAEYAFLSDCETVALVAADGSIEWMCLPRPDSPSTFGALLDRSAGFFRFGPSNVRVPDQRRYLPGTMVLETTWHAPTGWLTVRDALLIGPARSDVRRTNYRRVPGDAAAREPLIGTLGMPIRP
jgi:GH15 family glucan-1,4-alpha-glucosidase